jgi:hypothetical protein
MNEDVHNVSPTLGFIIKTIDYNGYVATGFEQALVLTNSPGTSLTFVNSTFRFDTKLLMPFRGCRRAENTSVILEELFRKD